MWFSEGERVQCYGVCCEVNGRKCREHDDSLFVLFIDLKKAYDSVPRMALWSVLQKCGVPPRMLSVIRSFHDNTLAEVRAGEATTDGFEVKNGL